VKVEILPDAESVARRGAALVAEAVRATLATRQRFHLALSGGRTPWRMLRILAQEEIAWDAVDVLQVDERVAPADAPERNLLHLKRSLLGHTPIPERQIHAMPVEDDDLAAAAARYAATLRELAGAPAVLDLVHLGLGVDGHTASLVPGDSVLEVADTDVAVTAAYQGRRRMTLTFPLLNRARRILWLVTGASKREMLARLRAADASIPAARVRGDAALVLADRAAAFSAT
jgi:6-phosphogluconolactonase